MLASIVKASLVIKYTVSDICCMHKFVSVRPRFMANTWLIYLCYGTRHFDGYRFITFSSVKKYLNGGDKKEHCTFNCLLHLHLA